MVVKRGKTPVEKFNNRLKRAVNLHGTIDALWLFNTHCGFLIQGLCRQQNTTMNNDVIILLKQLTGWRLLWEIAALVPTSC